ncbi:MAG: LysR family transcriptional regulator, partial [Bacteroidota bacterium]
NYTLHQLRIFACVARLQSVTKAAEELCLTQPAVSIQLKKLQEQFDIPLTERIGRQLFLTEFGQQIARVCERILAENEEIRYAMERYQGLLSGHIHIAVVSTGKYVMPYFLKGFVSQHPQVTVRMDVTNKNQVVAALEQNKTDFALVSVLPEGMPIEQISLMDNRLYFVGNQAESAKLPAPFQVEDLRELPLIFREPGSATRMAMETYLLQHGIPLQQTLALTSNEAVKQAVNAGLGFSIMPLIGLRHELVDGELQLIPLPGLPITTTWTLIYRKGKGLSPASRALLEYLETNKEDLIERHFSWTKGIA